MEKDRVNLVVGFLIGAAAGAVAGFLLAGGKKEDLRENLDQATGKIREELDDFVHKGETLMADLAGKIGELFDEKKSG